MKCVRCNTSLDNGALVCYHCGAVVGMSYGPTQGAPRAGFSAPTIVAPAFTPPAGATKRLPERVKGILLSPREEWRTVAGEPGGAMDIWSGYVIPLALIGPVALAIAQLAFGTALPAGGVLEVALVTGLAVAVLSFAFSLLQVAILAWGVNAMALKFRAIPDRLAALKVVAYSMTPVWLVGILYLWPALGVLWVFAAIYAIFLAFLGLQTLMRCTPPQALAYTFATLGFALVLWLGAGALVTALMGVG